MSHKLGLLVLAILPACSGTLTEAQHAGMAQHYGVDAAAVGVYPSPHCQALDDRRSTAQAVAAGALALGGVSGLSTIPVHRLLGDRQGAAYVGLGVVGVAAAATAAIAGKVEADATSAWVRDCSVK